MVLVYHGISYWFWTGNRRKAGHSLVVRLDEAWLARGESRGGALAILVAWNAC